MDNAKYRSELSKCVRCGSCKAFCPTHDASPEEAMGARGRLALLRALAAGDLSPSPLLCDRIFSCTLCGACTGLCPPGVDIEEVMYHGRAVLRQDDHERKFLRRVVRLAVNRPNLIYSLASVARYIFLPYLFKKGLIPFRIEFPDHPLRDIVKVMSVPRKKGRVALFTGCMVNYLYPPLGESLIGVLNVLGYEVIIPPTEVCCGAPLRSLGLEAEAQHLARRNTRLFNKLNVDAVVSLCPTCTLTIRHGYRVLIGDAIEKAQDISTFLYEKIEDVRLSVGYSSPKKALYHDPCHLKYALSVEKEPRELIRAAGIDLVKSREHRCCGFAGVFAITHREHSQRILDACVETYAETGADLIVTSCPGCITQLSRSQLERPVVHLIEVLEEALVRQPATTRA